MRLPSRGLVVLVGPSGAGKSTWASSAFRAGQVVSSDDLRAAVGESRDDQRASTDAFALLDQIIDLRLGRGLLTVVDTVGLDPVRRTAWIARARVAELPAVAVRFTTSPATVRARNRTRERPVPPAVLSRQVRDHEATTATALAAEGFDEVIEFDPPVRADPPETSHHGGSVSDAGGIHHGGSHSPAPSVVLVPRSVREAADLVAVQRTSPARMRFGLQIGRFDAASADLRDHLAAVAQAAEAAGFDSLWVMDHVVQIPQVGRAWEAMLESYATLSYLAGLTSRIRLGTLVTAITFRNLAHLAKIVATLDVLSGGRAICGLGAAWYQREHTAYGWDLPPLSQRYNVLRDACELLPLMWGPGTPAFEGRTITVPQAICYPRPLQDRIPILIGGSGERSTLRLVAEHADACNLFGDPAAVARRVAVLHAHCADVGRDPAAIEVTNLTDFLTAPDEATLARRVADLTVAGRASEGTIDRFHAATLHGQVGRFRAYADAGVQTTILAMPVLDAERVGEVAPLIAAFA